MPRPCSSESSCGAGFPSAVSCWCSVVCLWRPWSIAVAARPEPHTYLDQRSIRIIDDLTFELTPSHPNLRLIDQLVHPGYGILAPGSEPVNGPIGTGPFKFAGYRRDEWIAVERNERYRGEPARASGIG